MIFSVSCLQLACPMCRRYLTLRNTCRKLLRFSSCATTRSDGGLNVRANDYSFQVPPLLTHDSTHSFSTAFDDPVSIADVGNHFDNGTQDHFTPEGPSIDGNDKLLSLNLPTYNFTLLDYSLIRTALSLTAQLHGMFFVAETPRAVSADPTMPANELTCYRRNLFQITGSITLPRNLRYILTDRGDRIPILAQELVIVGTESVEGNSIKVCGDRVPSDSPRLTLAPSDYISSVEVTGCNLHPGGEDRERTEFDTARYNVQPRHGRRLRDLPRRLETTAIQNSNSK